jgi:hypothetical protein
MLDSSTRRHCDDSTNVNSGGRFRPRVRPNSLFAVRPPLTTASSPGLTAPFVVCLFVEISLREDSEYVPRP